MTVYHEDESCLAVQNTKDPVSAIHFLVIAKQKCKEGLDEANPGQMGHLMVVAGQVAKKLGLD